MNNTMKRRLYAAPTAELICLAPDMPIANNWTWSGSDNNSKWGKNPWGVNMFANASLTGFAEWTGEDELAGDDD